MANSERDRAQLHIEPRKKSQTMRLREEKLKHSGDPRDALTADLDETSVHLSVEGQSLASCRIVTRPLTGRWRRIGRKARHAAERLAGSRVPVAPGGRIGVSDPRSRAFTVSVRSRHVVLHDQWARIGADFSWSGVAIREFPAACQDSFAPIRDRATEIRCRRRLSRTAGTR